MVDPVDPYDEHYQQLRRLQQGDPEEWRHLFDRYNEPLCRFIGSREFVDKNDVYDIASDTWLRVWRARDSLSGVSNIWAWLCTIARNRAIDYSRNRMREITGERVPGYSYPGSESADDINIPAPGNFEEELAEFDLLDQAWREIIKNKKITKKQWECFTLRHVKKITFEEIAQRTKLKKTVVTVYCSQVMKIWREEYRKLQRGY